MQILDKRFGLTAVSMGFVTLDQVQEALTIQAEENVNASSHRLIGNILEDLGYLDAAETSKVLLSLNCDG